MTGSRKRTLMKYRSKKASRGSSRRVLVRSRRPQRGGASADAPAGLVSDARSWIENEMSNDLDGANVGLLYNNVKGWLSDEPDKLMNALAALREGAKSEMMTRFDRDGMDAAREYIDGIGLHSPQLKMQLQMQLNGAAALRRMAEAEAADAGDEADARGDAICAETPGQCCIDTTNDGDGSEVPADKLMKDADTIFVKADGGNFCRSLSSLTPELIKGFLVRICNRQRMDMSTGQEKAYYVPEDGYASHSRAIQHLDNIYVNARLFGSMNGVMFPLTDLFGYVLSIGIDAVDEDEKVSAAERTFVIRRDEPLEERNVIGYLAAAYNRPNDPMLKDAFNARERLVQSVYAIADEMHREFDVTKILTPEEEDAYSSMSWVSGMHCEPQDKLVMGRLLPESSDLQKDSGSLRGQAIWLADSPYGASILEVKPLSSVPTLQELRRRINLICDLYAQGKALDGEDQQYWVSELMENLTSTTAITTRLREISHNAQALNPSVLSAMFGKLRQMYAAAGDDSEEFISAIGRDFNCTPAGTWIEENNADAYGELEQEDDEDDDEDYAISRRALERDYDTSDDHDISDDRDISDDYDTRRSMFDRAVYEGVCRAYEGMTEDERTEVEHADDGVDSTEVVWAAIEAAMERVGLDPADVSDYFDEEELRNLQTEAWNSAMYSGCEADESDRGPMTLSELDTSGPGDGMLSPIQSRSPGIMLNTATPPLTPLSQSSEEPGDASDYLTEFVSDDEEPPVAAPGTPDMTPSTPPRSPREDPRVGSPPGAPTRRRRRTTDMEGGRKTKRRKAAKRRAVSKEKKTRGRKSKATKKQTRRRR